jgi:hypothetical protein
LVFHYCALGSFPFQYPVDFASCPLDVILLYPVPNVLSALCYDAIYLFLQVQKMCHQGKAGEGGALNTSDEPNTSDKADTAAPHNTPETNNHLRHTAAPALGANTGQGYPCSRAKQRPTVWCSHQACIRLPLRSDGGCCRAPNLTASPASAQQRSRSRC